MPHAVRCSLAYLHRPRFSSGRHGEDAGLVPVWEILHAAGVDVVLSGHDHDYERFAPMDPLGREDPEGVRQFVVGTGGGYVLPVGAATAGSEARNGETFGVLRLELEPGRYEWEFIPVADGEFTDAGSATCSRPGPRDNG